MAPAGKEQERKRLRRNVRIPLSWRALALASVVPLGAAIFLFGVHHAGVAVPISEKDRDPIFFSFIFAVLIPWFIYSIIKVVMKNILLKKSAGETGKEVAKDVAAAVAVAVIDGLTGSSGSGGSGSGGSSSDDARGGGGGFGGGGSSGGY